ncbi:shikimate dehydrogenase [Caloramator quimbayensis]|uniref:Shikimate dehydrogenase (NADP(+)) n=1 Tax=Caloramator quimbayensis TaxID=1147123 RepID=A0A1T4WYY1_9CLOT|nr:shikimate dehydrogenase [Caloramator quimbayensis]SKA81791.1 shikimate dehydrogenase [Caloramator quimbayensis]
MKDNLYGLLGYKLTHSISPVIHEEILKRLNIDGRYELFEIEEYKLEDSIKRFKTSSIRGLNVTVPYKITALKYIDELSEEVKNIGSINTILFENGKTKGFNTDYYGFSLMLDKYDLNIKGKKALILGTGGAARAVVFSLLNKGIDKIYIASRNAYKAKTGKWPPIAEILSYDYLKGLKNMDYIINCTPVGMFPNIDSSPADREIIKNFSAAIDLIYNPYKTLFLKDAEELGLKAFNGLYMLVAQAVISQEIWNNIAIDKNQIDIIFELIKEKIYL